MIDLRPDIVLPGQYALRLDPRHGLIMPWYVHGALDEIVSWGDISDKTVLEWGGGCSTLWWSRVAKSVYAIEVHQEWADWIAAEAAKRGFDNVVVERRDPATDGYFDARAVDIVCIDGSERTKCLEKALTFPRPLTIIFDNWQQDGVYTDEHAVEMMSCYEGKFFVQADHTAHEGHPWQTAIWRLV